MFVAGAPDSMEVMPMPPDEPIGATTALEQLGRYQLLGKLGQGGMGTVFLANDMRLDRRVAVKVLPPETVHNPDAVARFQREAKALAKLSHPGIVQAFDSEEDNGRHFLVMEYVEGQSLLDVLKRDRRIAPTYAADYIHQAAAALQHAHDKGLVHRDLKPSNLLLSSSGQIKILDLGLARFLQDQIGDPTKTREGMGLGTPDYASPEQFRDAHHVDGRADIYALGCTLYHLLTGQVPFPGSSLAEKYDAHQKREPTPLKDLCADMPGGLVLVVQRMMAKHPAERFQTAAEAAEALAPYVAGSSASFSNFATKVNWQGSQITMKAFEPRTGRMRRLVWAASASALAVAVLVILVSAWPKLFPSSRSISNLEPDSGNPTAQDEPGQGGPKPREVIGAPQPDANVLTVSQEDKDGGTYRTINDALEKIKPGQIVRVLDNGVYRETVRLNRPSVHAGITLEAPRGATLECPLEKPNLIEIDGVPNVAVRDLILRVKGTRLTSLVFVHDQVADVVLERIDMGPGSPGAAFNGIEVQRIPGSPEESRPSVTIRNCVVRQAQIGINNMGIVGDYSTITPVRGVLVTDNRFIDCGWGVMVRGSVRKLHVVGNRFLGCSHAGFQLECLQDDSGEILVANNTMFECKHFMRVWDDKMRTHDVHILNNLSLAGLFPDALAFDSGGNPLKPKGYAEGKKYAERWKFSRNRREVKQPYLPIPESDGWIPAGPNDVVKEKIEVISRDSNSPDFLRPAKDTEEAQNGSGVDDPSLPAYVGALPPPGVPPWDWNRTWRMPRDAQLLTVSKDAKDGGKYRSLNDALKDAKPWGTIRVLDGATYEETITLTDAKRHKGITIVAIKSATLKMGKGVHRVAMIRDVPHVQIAGFKFSDSPLDSNIYGTFVFVSGRATGVTLIGLELLPKTPKFGVVVENTFASIAEPLRIEGCTIRPTCPVSNDGFAVLGNLTLEPTSGLCIRFNRVFNCVRGINLRGSLRDIQVAANLLVRNRDVAIQTEDLDPASRGILIANNSAFAGGGGFRRWDNPSGTSPTAGQAEVVNNLFFGSHSCDMGFVYSHGGDATVAGDAVALFKLWRFSCNCRDFSGASNGRLPESPEDVWLGPEDLVSMDEEHPDQVRPGKDSRLATAGAGRNDPVLPKYIGALTPEGVQPWDWDRTWRATFPRSDLDKSAARDKH
jgi:serine/threonine protein kinase/nitrous oxidase accessory protein NosD